MENVNLGHLMLDLETMGNKSNAAIVSIGAVEFNINTGETGREFYERIHLQSAINAGLKAEGGTIMWWLQQSQEARDEICKVGDNLNNVLEKLKSFMSNLGQFHIWGNGLRFDVGILEDAYVACGYETMPWHPKRELDVRTLVLYAPEIKANWVMSGMLHNPIDDCKHQIGYCNAIWKKMHNIK
jgi:hypothetical protein